MVMINMLLVFIVSLFLFVGNCPAFTYDPNAANVFFVHGFNVSEQGARTWAATMFKGLYQSGARMNFHPVSWKSDAGASWNYHANVTNAFVTAGYLAQMVNEVGGRRVVIAHSLGTMLAASAIQDHGMQVDKLIMLNSAIPSEAFDPTLADTNPSNRLVHDDWMEYPSRCWATEWHALFDAGDARSKLTWRGRFRDVGAVAVNFYSSGDEVLEIFSDRHNPPFYEGLFDESTKGRYAWQKQELFKGRKTGTLAPVPGTSDWSGWGFETVLDTGLTGESVQYVNRYSAFDASQLSLDHLRTNAVFQLTPSSITNSAMSRFELDCHLAQGIPALSCAAGITDLSDIGILSIDINSTAYRPNGWPAGRDPPLANRWLHSDIKDVAYFYTHKVFEEIVRIGGLK